MQGMIRHQWLVVGAGPAGITAVGKLLDRGVNPREIAWVDPAFQVGDLGQRWMNVPSNTTVKLFLTYLQATQSFKRIQKDALAHLEKMDPEGTCLLKEVAYPLQEISNYFRECVRSVCGRVSLLRQVADSWLATLDDGLMIEASRVILAPGGEPKSLSLPFPVQENISLECALNPELLSRELDAGERVAVFGSSHSAVLVMKNLLELGCEVVNFHLSPLRYAIYHEGWIEYDNTGLKGLAAQWARAHLEVPLHPHLIRYSSDQPSMERYLPTCQKIIYAVGFSKRLIKIEGVDPDRYDPHIGQLNVENLYGCGLAYPELVQDKRGREEWNIGLWKFSYYLDRVLAHWFSTRFVTS